MEYRNYVSIRKMSIRYKYYCYVDTKEYLADALFIKNNVRVWFRNEACKPDTDFVFIICKVKKSDTTRFLESLEDLKKKMILFGYYDYEAFCKKYNEIFLAEEDKR